MRLFSPNRFFRMCAYSRLKQAYTKKEEVHCHSRMPVKQKPTALNLLFLYGDPSSMAYPRDRSRAGGPGVAARIM